MNGKYEEMDVLLVRCKRITVRTDLAANRPVKAYIHLMFSQRFGLHFPL